MFRKLQKRMDQLQKMNLQLEQMNLIFTTITPTRQKLTVKLPRYTYAETREPLAPCTAARSAARATDNRRANGSRRSQRRREQYITLIYVGPVDQIRQVHRQDIVLLAIPLSLQALVLACITLQMHINITAPQRQDLGTLVLA